MSVQIRRITAIPVRVPVAREKVNCDAFSYEPLNRGPTGGWDGDFFGDVPFMIVSVEGDGGPRGVASCTRGQTIETFCKVAGGLIGLPIEQLEPRAQLVDERYFRGLHTALLDFRARCEGRPLYELFGKKIRDGIRAAAWTGFRTSQGAARLAGEAQSKGFGSLKLKASIDVDGVDIAQAVREACGDEFHLVIDPNGRWLTEQRAIDNAKRLAAVSPAVYLEDPLYGEEFQTYVKLRRLGVKCIKTVASSKFAARAVEVDAIDAFNLAGTWPSIIEAADVAEQHNVPFWVGSSVETALADASVIHFGVTHKAFTFDCEMAGSQVRDHGLTVQPLRYHNGMALLPDDGPGLGVEPDWHAIERYRVGDPVVVQ